MARPGINCKRRSLGSAFKVALIEIDENDDEAERMSIRRSSVCSIKTEKGEEIQSAGNSGYQMRKCIQMSIENKINEKNAFQIKLIDFLVDALRKHDPNMDNFQVASASLDASAKIYGFRVDKVHTDLIKLLGINLNKRKRTNEDGEIEDEQSDNENRRVRRKKKRYQNEIISTTESLKSKLNLSNPFRFSLNCPVESLTSDMLLMVHLPQHVNQGNALSLFNYVVLDRLPATDGKSVNSVSINKIDNFTRLPLCPLFSNFRFFGWSTGNNHGYSYEQYTRAESESEYDFHLDDDMSSIGGMGNDNSTVEDDFVENNMENIGDVVNTIRQSQRKNYGHSDETKENIYHNFVQPDLEDNVVSDFMEIIASANPEAAFEYSYTNRSMIRWNGPSYWRLKANKNAKKRNIEVLSRKKCLMKKKKELVLSFTMDFREKIEKCFEPNKKGTTLKNSTEWKDQDKCNMHIIYDPRRFYSFFTKIVENENNSDECDLNNVDHNSDFIHDHCYDLDKDSDEEELLGNSTQATEEPEVSFLDNNLEPISKYVDSIMNNNAISWPRRAKKFNMHEIKNKMWEIVTGPSQENQETTTADNQNILSSIEPKLFSDVCSELPKKLSKVDAAAFNSSIAFVTLMQLANEKHLIIEQEKLLSDLLVTSKECN